MRPAGIQRQVQPDALQQQAAMLPGGFEPALEWLRGGYGLREGRSLLPELLLTQGDGPVRGRLGSARPGGG